jgi:hypothetical protein
MQELDQDPGYPSLDLVELDDLFHTARLIDDTGASYLYSIFDLKVFKAAVAE